MDTKTLNNIVEQNKRNIAECITQHIQYANARTIDLFVLGVSKHHHHTDMKILRLFHSRHLLTKKHIDDLIHMQDSRYYVSDILKEFDFKYDNNTWISYCDWHDKTYDVPECSIILDKLIENKQTITHTGAEFLYKIFCKSSTKLKKYLDAFFDLGYVPSNEIVNYLSNIKNMRQFLRKTITRFKLKLTKEQQELCQKNNIYIGDTLTIEDKFKYYKMSDFKKEILDAKLTMQCLYNACSILNNVASVKTLVEKYGIKPDEKCLEISTSIPDNFKVNDYLITAGVSVSNKCIINMIDGCKFANNSFYIKWKEQQQTTIDALQINGIDD